MLQPTIRMNQGNKSQFTINLNSSFTPKTLMVLHRIVLFKSGFALILREPTQNEFS